MNWLLRISNTHREIAIKELESLIGAKTSVQWIMPLLVRIDAEKGDIDKIIDKMASLKWVIQNPLLVSPSDFFSLQSDKIAHQIPPTGTDTFAARFNQIMVNIPELSKSKTERFVGGLILDCFPSLQVSLDNPNSVYRVCYFIDCYVMGWTYAEQTFQRIEESSPKMSPFFGGGAMKPMLTKILVNLLYPLHPIVLDPFCGHGGFMRGIASAGSFAIGIEVSMKIARECKVNNQYHQVEQTQIIIGDALHQPFRRASIPEIISDPPYAKQSTTIGRDREDLIERWLNSSDQERVLITLPKDMVFEINNNWKLEYEIDDFVHKSLTRVVRKLVRLK